MATKLTGWEGFPDALPCGCPPCECTNKVGFEYESEQKHAEVIKCGFANLDDGTVTPAHTGDGLVYGEYTVTRVYRNPADSSTDSEEERFYIDGDGPGIYVTELNFIDQGHSCGSIATQWLSGPVDQGIYSELVSETKSYDPADRISDASAATEAKSQGDAQSWVSGGRTSEWGYLNRVSVDEGDEHWSAEYFLARSKITLTVPGGLTLPPPGAVFIARIDLYLGDDPGPYDKVDTQNVRLSWDSGRTWKSDWITNPVMTDPEMKAFPVITSALIACMDQYQDDMDITTE